MVLMEHKDHQELMVLMEHNDHQVHPVRNQINQTLLYHVLGPVNSTTASVNLISSSAICDPGDVIIEGSSNLFSISPDTFGDIRLLDTDVVNTDEYRIILQTNGTSQQFIQSKALCFDNLPAHIP